jgi:hypothetical protein
LSILENDNDYWSDNYLVDRIFNSLDENGTDKQTKSNKYILQLDKKFLLFISGSPEVRFNIYTSDLDEECLSKLKERVKNCKTVEESYSKLNYIFTEVIYRIAKQTEPYISSRTIGKDPTIDKMQFNRMREWVSDKWKIVN